MEWLQQGRAAGRLPVRPSCEIPARHARSRFFAPTTDEEGRRERGRSEALFLRVKLKYGRKEEGGGRVGGRERERGAMLVRGPWQTPGTQSPLCGQAEADKGGREGGRGQQ